MPTKNQLMSADVTALLRARNTLLWVTTREEVRVERAITEAAGAAKYEIRFWDCARGITDGTGRVIDAVNDPVAATRWIEKQNGRVVLVMRDLHKWWDQMVLRSCRNVARGLQELDRKQAKAVVILTPSGEVPPELAGHATVLEWPLPERLEIAGILDTVINALGEELQKTALPDRDAAIDAAVGLTAEEASNCFAKSLVTSKTIDPKIIAAEKKRVIAREKVLEWFDPDPRGLDAVGGLEVLKAWLVEQKTALTQNAREYGLPAPKGVLLVGQPGCGKSLTAKAVASAWGLPLLRLDMGALKSKYVGESEGNIRKALAVAEAVSPCVLWLDEIEKALAGSTGTQGDGGVSADALGAILTWMQERSGSVFVVATANDVTALPPALLRKGRFDELFFVDLPTLAERREILIASIRKLGRKPERFDVDSLARGMDRWAGVEIATVVEKALFLSFADGARELETTDIRAAALKITPLADTVGSSILSLQDWAKGKATRASLPEKESAGGRALDLDEDVN